MSLKEYIITLRDFEDLEKFYDDMETPGGSLYIPSRRIDVTHRRNLSRNTHYLLTQEEADLISKDPRVLGVQLNYKDAGIEIVPYAINKIKADDYYYAMVSNYWAKNSSSPAPGAPLYNATSNPLHDNWGLLRCYEGTNRPSWGDGSYVGISPYATGTLPLTSTGRNVDVVISDGIMKPNHPEWRALDNYSIDRNKRFNWHSLNSIVGAASTGPYDYDGKFNNLLQNDQNNHGNHVAGTVAGYKYGWAKNANIYNISPYDEESYYTIDYIRAFHLNKSINPITGRKNPTIVNMSYGYRTNYYVDSIARVYFQGVMYTKPSTGWTVTDVNRFGWQPNQFTFSMAYRNIAEDADLTDAINDGVVLVGAAGNENAYSDVPGGKDYNNYIQLDSTYSSRIFYYHRGSSQGGCPGVINVGAMDNWYRTPPSGNYGLEIKAWFSNAGPRVDVYAPGTAIMSSWGRVGINNTNPAYPAYVDPLSYGGTDYYTIKIDGTSMASPQVTGMLACHAEVLQGMDQADARNIIIKNSQKDAITSAPFDSTYPSTTLRSDQSIKGGPNRYLKYVRETPTSGVLYPKRNYNQQYYNNRENIENVYDPTKTKSSLVESIFTIPQTSDLRTKSGWPKFLINYGLRFTFSNPNINNNYSVVFPHSGYYDFRFCVDYFGSVSLDNTTVITGSSPYEYFYKSVYVTAGTHNINVNAVADMNSTPGAALFAVALTISYNKKIKSSLTYPRPKIRIKG